MFEIKFTKLSNLNRKNMAFSLKIDTSLDISVQIARVHIYDRMRIRA